MIAIFTVMHVKTSLPCRLPSHPSHPSYPSKGLMLKSTEIEAQALGLRHKIGNPLRGQKFCTVLRAQMSRTILRGQMSRTVLRGQMFRTV